MLMAVLMVLTVLGLVGGLAFAGLWLCWTGIVGRVLDQHAHCATCDYDLYGHGLVPRQCPECGTYLYQPEAVRVGSRQMCPERVVTGTLSLALGVLPLLWLMHETEQSGAAAHTQIALQYHPMQPAQQQTTQAQHAGTTSQRYTAQHSRGSERTPSADPTQRSGRTSHRSPTNIEVELQDDRSKQEGVTYAGDSGIGVSAVAEMQLAELYEADRWMNWQSGRDSSVKRIEFDTWLAEAATPTAAEVADRLSKRTPRLPSYPGSASGLGRSDATGVPDMDGVRDGVSGGSGYYDLTSRPYEEPWSTHSLWQERYNAAARTFSPQDFSSRSFSRRADRRSSAGAIGRTGRISPRQIRSQPVPAGRVNFN